MLFREGVVLGPAVLVLGECVSLVRVKGGARGGLVVRLCAWGRGGCVVVVEGSVIGVCRVGMRVRVSVLHVRVRHPHGVQVKARQRLSECQ